MDYWNKIRSPCFTLSFLVIKFSIRVSGQFNETETIVWTSDGKTVNTNTQKDAGPLPNNEQELIQSNHKCKS